MRRRSFITKALAGLAAVPVVGKVVHAKAQMYQEAVASNNPVAYFRLDEPPAPQPIYAALYEHTDRGLYEVTAPDYQRATLKDGKFTFPHSDGKYWWYVTHIAFANGPTDPPFCLLPLHESGNYLRSINAALYTQKLSKT